MNLLEAHAKIRAEGGCGDIRMCSACRFALEALLDDNALEAFLENLRN